MFNFSLAPIMVKAIVQSLIDLQWTKVTSLSFLKSDMGDIGVEHLVHDCVSGFRLQALLFRPLFCLKFLLSPSLKSLTRVSARWHVNIFKTCFWRPLAKSKFCVLISIRLQVLELNCLPKEFVPTPLSKFYLYLIARSIAKRHSPLALF